jgi:hypothetical protein
MGTGYAATPVQSEFAYSGTWALASGSSAIYINGDATVYGYYPYTGSAIMSSTSSGNTIPITVTANQTFDAANQVDYMRATPTAVSKTNREASLTLNHVLAELTFTIKKGSTYAGTGTLSEIKLVKGTGTFNVAESGTGTMEIIDKGTLSFPSSGGTTSTLTFSGTKTISTDGASVTALVAPAPTLKNGENNDVTLSLKIDDNTYSTPLTTVNVNSWTAAYNYTYTITVNSSGLSIASVGITDWTSATTNENSFAVQ